MWKLCYERIQISREISLSVKLVHTGKMVDLLVQSNPL